MLVHKPYKVAIIDDEPLQLAFFKKVIGKNKDFEALTFADPKKALKEIKEQKIRVVITDINMPEMNGDDVLRQAIKLKQGISTFIITSSSSLIMANTCFALGARGVLLKPIQTLDINRILVETKTHLDEWNQVLKDVVDASEDMKKAVGQ